MTREHEDLSSPIALACHQIAPSANNCRPSKLPERPRRVSLTRLIAQFSPPDSFIAGFRSLLSVTRRVHPTRLHQAPDRYEAQFSFCKKLSTRGRPRRRVRAFSRAEDRQGVLPAHDQHAPCTLRAVSFRRLGLENRKDVEFER